MLRHSLIVVFALGAATLQTRCAMAQDADGLTPPAATPAGPTTNVETNSEEAARHARDVTEDGFLSQSGNKFQLQLIGGPIILHQVRLFTLEPANDEVER